MWIASLSTSQRPSLLDQCGFVLRKVRRYAPSSVPAPQGEGKPALARDPPRCSPVMRHPPHPQPPHPTPAPGHRTYRACAAPNRLTCDSICFTLSVLGHEPHPRRGAICLVHHAPRVSAVTPGAALTFAARFTSAERKHQLQRFLSKAPARGCPEVPPRHF